MNKITALLLSLLLVFGCCVAVAEDVDLTGYSDDELRLLRDRIDVELSARTAAATLDGGVLAEGDVGEYHVAILGVDLVEDYKGNPALLIRYLYTNNGKNAKSFMVACSSKAFQNGVQCEGAITMNSSEIGHDPNAIMLQVQPGASLECTEVVVLQDTTSPVEIQVGKLIDMSANPERVVVTVAIPAE